MPAEGWLSFEPRVAPMTAISPSRFSSMQACALREVWHSSRIPELLPPSPASRLGSAIHFFLEEAGAGRMAAEAIDDRWQALIAAAEERMCKNWLERHNVPLRRSVPKFEVRRLQAASRALALIMSRKGSPATSSKTEPPRFGYEFPVSSADKKVAGKIDAVLPTSDGAVIQDYKSGQIFVDTIDGGRVIKEAIETQLRMYAALYASTAGNWPARLDVVPLHGAAHPVEFDRETAVTLVNAARHLLEATNNKITRLADDREQLETDLAVPSQSSCKYCQYRPGCRAYAKAATIDESGWPADVRGKVVEAITLANSSLGLTVDTEAGTARVRGIASDLERHPALADLAIGSPIAVFNLTRTASPMLFAESGATTIYRT
jgi:CRISPR/Cas system-associated exonuclease Cas4 (RecB family)